MDAVTAWVDQRVRVLGSAMADRLVERAGMDAFLARLADEFGAFLLGLNDQLHIIEEK